MDADLHVMYAVYIIDWSEMNAHDQLMVAACICAKILDFQKKCTCPFDGRGRSLLNTCWIQNAVALHFDLQNCSMHYSVTAYVASIEWSSASNPRNTGVEPHYQHQRLGCKQRPRKKGSHPYHVYKKTSDNRTGTRRGGDTDCKAAALY